MERINEDFTKLYKRWSNGDVRKEDDIKYMNRVDFVEYLNTIYKRVNSFGNACRTDFLNSIVLPIWKSPGGGYRVDAEFRKDKEIVLSPNALTLYKLYPDLQNILKDKYNVIRDIEIYSKENENTNKFYIEVVDTLLGFLNDNVMIEKVK